MVIKGQIPDQEPIREFPIPLGEVGVRASHRRTRSKKPAAIRATLTPDPLLGPARWVVGAAPEQR